MSGNASTTADVTGKVSSNPFSGIDGCVATYGVVSVISLLWDDILGDAWSAVVSGYIPRGHGSSFIT